jgi:hypothetical protein
MQMEDIPPFRTYERKWLPDSRQRPGLFLFWAKDMIYVYRIQQAAPVVWADLVREWSGFDLIDHAAFERLLKRIKSRRPPAIEAELPSGPVEVYRGQSALSPVGLSWTLDRSVAEGFARGHRGLRVPEPVVLTRVVTRDEMAFYTNDREESEVVTFRPPEGNLSIKQYHHQEQQR